MRPAIPGGPKAVARSAALPGTGGRPGESAASATSGSPRRAGRSPAAARTASVVNMASRTSRSSALAPVRAKATGRPCRVQTRCGRNPQKYRECEAQYPYSAHLPGSPAERRRVAAPDHRSPSRCHRRRAGLGRRRPGRLRRDHPGPRRWPIWARPGAPAGAVQVIAVAAALAAAAAAVVLDRARPAAGPPPPDDTRQPGPDADRPWTTATVQGRPGLCGRRPARLTHMPSRRQNTQICSPQKTNAKGRSAALNGGSRSR
jgi:hypothetical protein